MIDPRYCCCAVPVVNAGIYFLIFEQLVVSITVGVLAVGTPDVVGTSVPNFATVIFAITCWIVAVCQPAGFIGVFREKTTLFKTYSIVNALAIAAAFSTAAALIITSALRHNTAVSVCEKTFFSPSDTASAAFSSAANTTLTSEGSALCSAFAWADVGIMGGLWLILLIVQSYFLYVTRTYSTSQVSDHKLYHSVYSENPEAFTMSILRSTRYNPGSVYNTMPPPNPHTDEWDARPSMDSVREEAGPGVGAGGYYAGAHQRGMSDATVRGGDGQYDDAYGEGSRAYPDEHDGYRDAGGVEYPQHQQQGYGNDQQGQYPFSQPGGGYVEHPAEARQARDQQTPVLNQYQDSGRGQQGAGSSWGGGNGNLRRPEEAQSHPGE